MNGSIDRRLVDDAADAYLAWRTECDAVWSAYDRWRNGPVADAALTFAAYLAVLDREGHAAAVYSGAIARAVGPQVTDPWRVEGLLPPLSRRSRG